MEPSLRTDDHNTRGWGAVSSKNDLKQRRKKSPNHQLKSVTQEGAGPVSKGEVKPLTGFLVLR